MQHDERNLPLSTDNAEAVLLFDRAVEHFLKFHADTMVLVGRAIAADPDFVMGHCLKAYLLLMAANPANRAQIDATLANARKGEANLTVRERMHLAAATAWHQGAERALDAALERDPTNYFAHHVKAHVLDTDGRAREGNAWLAAQTVHWSLGNNLIHHLWWHRTLMQLDLGERAAVLASYDENIRNFADPMTQATPDHYVDLQNACARLWRLEAQGLDVGHRWDELADKAEARIGEAGHLLMVPHLMMALAATGRDAAAARFLAALHELAADPQLWTAPAIADVVIPVCEAAQAHRRGQHARVVDLLEPRQAQIRLLGGSNAQRDLFFQMLVDAAVKADRRDVVSAMIAHETATRTVPPAQRAGYAAAARWLHS